ncbi:MAG: type VI secretion system tip protein VgrG, partial [Desulfamplus sp.]|nr:type VI secretion system tip protein VgrG [Desulfamplus sp.]
AIDSTIQFRSARTTPKPSVNGPQTAFVVGPSGDEIYTDKYGRVKVHFHWDRESKKDENSSCWIRVSQNWAGSKWGAMHIPRIGQEVIVEFIEGDPDHPIITGRVYNGKAMPPYDLPAEKTKSTVKSNSTKGGAGFNEFRFEDKKGDEQIFIHAERNMDTRVKNDSLERIYGNRHQIIGWEKDGKKGGDQREMVYQDKHLKVHRNDTTHIGGDMQLLIGGIEGDGNQDIVIKADKKETIDQNHHHHVKQDRIEKIDGTQSLTIGGDQQEKVGMNHALKAGNEIHLKAGMKIIIEAGLQISLKVGGNFVDIGPAGVTIQGTMVKVNCPGGMSGTGSGSSPASVKNAKKAKPVKPGMADNAKPGKVDKVP